MTAGRKEKLIDLDKVEELASRGLTEQQIADCLGISTDTIGRRKKKYADFAETIKRGQASGVSQVSNALFEQAMSGQTAAAIFYMKNRANWTDKQQHTGPDGGAVQVQIVKEFRNGDN